MRDEVKGDFMEEVGRNKGEQARALQVFSSKSTFSGSFPVTWTSGTWPAETWMFCVRVSKQEQTQVWTFQDKELR